MQAILTHLRVISQVQASQRQYNMKEQVEIKKWLTEKSSMLCTTTMSESVEQQHQMVSIYNIEYLETHELNRSMENIKQQKNKEWKLR